jgi:hypothetical protein
MLTRTTTDSDVTALTVGNYGVLIVVDQPGASAGALASLGAAWMTTLGTFTQAGGVVVVLDGDTGIKEMPQLVSATGLLGVTAQAVVTPLTTLDVVARGDVVASGVGTIYAAASNTATVTTEPNGGNLTYVVVSPSGDGAPGVPVVVHKVF